MKMTYTTITNGTLPDADEVMGNFALTLFGDGSDGAFSETTGDTALTQGTVYQYSSFSLTGDATISTTKTTGEPIVILVQGDCTINTTGTCDFAGVGEDSPTSIRARTADYERSLSYIDFYKNATNGSSTSDGAAAAAGRGGTPPIYTNLIQINPFYKRLGLPFLVCSGTKGGNGDWNDSGVITGTPSGGTGASGGGSLILLVGGDLTITSGTFDMTGSDGTAGSVAGVSGTGEALAQGGGGGGGGSLYFSCNGTLSDSGTYQVTGGSGGAGAIYNSYDTATYVGSGGGGASLINAGNNGAGDNNGTTSGGTGATGVAIRTEIE
jgi:hypothetical protein